MNRLILGALNYSSWSVRALLVAKASGLKISELVLPLGRDDIRDILYNITGNYQVPALICKNCVILDSLAITEWFAENSSSGSIWPANCDKRAVARSVVAEMHSGFEALQTELPFDLRSDYETPKLSDQTMRDINRIMDLWRELRGLYWTEGPYLFGPWSAADAFYAPVASQFRTYKIELDSAAQEYSKNVLSQPDMQDIFERAKSEPWVLEQTADGPKFIGTRSFDRRC